MNRMIVATTVLVVLGSAVYLSMRHHENESARIKPGGGVAVLELFTSEGCSSCPAADKLLGEMIETYRGNELPVYPLAFHVDYWNYLGWKDDYSRAEFTRRQQAYGAKFGLHSIYTPQVVVNGTDEFVGSSRSRMVEAVSRALSAGSETEVDLNINRRDLQIDVDVRLDPVPANSFIVIVVAERGIKREIRRGENAGQTLHHENVVRVLETAESASSSVVSVRLPGDLKPANSSVVALVQDKSTLKILGASARDLVLP